MRYNVIENMGQKWDIYSSNNHLFRALSIMDRKHHGILVTYLAKTKRFRVDIVSKPEKQKLGFLENRVLEYSTNTDEKKFSELLRERIYMMINIPQWPLDNIDFRRLVIFEFLIEYKGFTSMDKWDIYHRTISLNALVSK